MLEFLPKGYDSWYQYQRAVARRKKVLDIVVAVFTFILLIGAYTLVSYME